MNQGMPAPRGHSQRLPNDRNARQHQLMDFGPQGSSLGSSLSALRPYGQASPYMPQASLRQPSPPPSQPQQAPVPWANSTTSEYQEPYDQRSLRKMFRDAPPEQRAELSRRYHMGGEHARPRRSPRRRSPNYVHDAGDGQGLERALRDEMRKQFLAIERLLWLSINPIAQRLDHQADRHAALLDHFAQQETLLKHMLQGMQGHLPTQGVLFSARGRASSEGWGNVSSVTPRSTMEARDTSAQFWLASPQENCSPIRDLREDPSALTLGNTTIESEGTLLSPGEEGIAEAAAEKTVAKTEAPSQDMPKKMQKITRAGTAKSQSAPGDSLVSRVVLSEKFQLLCTLVILLNAAYMGIVADIEIRSAVAHINGEGKLVDMAALKVTMETAFLAFYTLELTLKLTVFKLEFFTNADWAWNCFDFVLVVSGLLSVFDLVAEDIVWMRTVKAAARIVRVFRAARVVKYFRELRVIILSIASSFRSFIWGIILMALMAYLCCVVALQGITEYLERQRATGYENVPEAVRTSLDKNWSTLGSAMLAQYRTVTGGGPWGLTVEPLLVCDWFYYAVFLVYVAMLMVAVTKLLTGIFVQQANLAAKKDHAEFISESVKQVFNALDDDGSGYVSKEEFRACVGFKAARDFLKEMDIRPEDALKLFDLVDDDNSGHIDIDEFIHGCQRFSGTAKNFDMTLAMKRLDSMSVDLKNVLLFLDGQAAMAGMAPELATGLQFTPVDTKQDLVLM